MRCGKSCKVYDFELHQGAGTKVSLEFKYLGLKGSAVTQLVENLSQKVNFKVILNNFFTGIALLLVYVIFGDSSAKSNGCCNG